MTYRIATLVLAIVASLTSVPLVAQDRSVKSEQDRLIDLEKKWNAAFYADKDPMFIENVLADDYIAIYGDGSRGDKAKELGIARSFSQQVLSAVQDEFTVKIFGDTAVVWFTLRLVGPVRGEPMETTTRYVDVFVRRDNRWQCVSSQSTKVLG